MALYRPIAMEDIFMALLLLPWWPLFHGPALIARLLWSSETFWMVFTLLFLLWFVVLILSILRFWSISTCWCSLSRSTTWDFSVWGWVAFSPPKLEFVIKYLYPCRILFLLSYVTFFQLFSMLFWQGGNRYSWILYSRGQVPLVNHTSTLFKKRKFWQLKWLSG